MHTLTIASYGYFLYPVTNHQCAKFAAPHVDGEPHSCHILAVGQGQASGVPAPGVPWILRDCTVHTKTQKPATLVNFDRIVDFASLSCGAKLRRNWDTRDPQHTNVQVALAGEKLTAWPDPFTNVKQWKWFHCGPTVVQKALTSLTVYELPDWDGKLNFVKRQDNGTEGHIRFTSDATIGLLHLPDNPDADEEKVDREHAESTRRLCDQSGAALQLGVEVGKESKHPPLKSLNPSILKFLGLQGERFKGRPNCGARQIAV